MTDTAPAIPLPRPTPVSRPFWDGCRREQLLVQRCTACGHRVFIPEEVCTACLSPALAWAPSSGRGVVYSFTVVWRPQQPGFQPPYVPAIVEMEEGWHLLTDIIDCPVEAVHVGLPVEVAFRRMSDEITLPYFRPRAAP